MAYFANGWPKTYLLPHHHCNPSPTSSSKTTSPANRPHPVHALHMDRSSRFLLTVSDRALHVWNARQHRLLLARFIVSDAVFEREGPLIDAVWSLSSRAIITAFKSGLVLLFSLSTHPLSLSLLPSISDPSLHDQYQPNQSSSSSSSPSPPSLYPLQLSRLAELRVAHAEHSITCLTSCPAGALIATSSSALTCISWDAEILWRAHIPELLRNNNAMAKMGLNLSSSSTCTPAITRILNEAQPDTAGGIIALTYNQETAFCALVLGDGPALLLAMHSAGHSRPSAIDGRWLRSSDAVSIALEPRRMLATVGLSNGDVEQYYIGVPAGDECPLMRTISLSNWYFEPADIGRPLVLQWTADGAALVVGWERTGLAVWSVSGCRLMWTLPQVGGPLPTPTSATRSNGSGASFSSSGFGPLQHGVRAACWGPRGFFLWAAPTISIDSSSNLQNSSSSLNFCHFMEFSFLKNEISGGSVGQSESSRLALLGSDRVLLLRHADHSQQHHHSLGATSAHELELAQMQQQLTQNIHANDLFSWQHLLIPQDYLWRNWPLTSIAVSSDASHIAVAGEHGVAICHVRSQRWRVFADLEQNGRRIRCSALAWVGKTIVIGNEIIVKSSSSSSLSSRNSNSNITNGITGDVNRRSTSTTSANFSNQSITTKHELLFYLRDQGDSTTLQTQKSLPSRPVLTDVRADGYLLVMCEDARVFLFKMTEHYSRSRVDVHEVYNLLLPTRESGLMYKQDVAQTSAMSIASAAAAAAAAAASNGTTSLDHDHESDDHHGTMTMSQPPPPAPGGGITEAKIFPPLTHAKPLTSSSETAIPTHIMLLRSTGSLILLDTESMVSTALLRYVERFWYTPEHCTPFDMMKHQPVWWAYGDDGLHVCFKNVTDDNDDDGDSNNNDVFDNEDIDISFGNDSPSLRQAIASSRKKRVEVEQWFELDAEVYPLAIMSKYGMLLSATQGLVVNSVDLASPAPRHTIQVKRQPILHTLLRHILMKPYADERLALQVALKCVSQPQFVDSLEWLLYEAVLEHDDENGSLSIHHHQQQQKQQHHQQSQETNGHAIDNDNDKSDSAKFDRLAKRTAQHASIAKGFPESPRRRKAGSGLFPRVIRLLKYFGEYEDVVVRCARKLDSKRWPLLFSLAGEPAALLEQCFVSGRLRTAACLLVILQEMWGFISSTPHSLRLVEAALARGEIDLAADLANFLSKADRAGMLNSSQLRSVEDVSWIAEAARAPRSYALAKFHPRRSSGGGGGGGGANNSSIDDINDHQHNKTTTTTAYTNNTNRIPAVDAAVLNHARWLLTRMDLRALVNMAIKMDFPLDEWLKRELKGKNASRPFVRDFGNTILSLHRQFQCPEPDLTDVRQAMTTFNIEMDATKSRHFSSSSSPSPDTTTIITDSDSQQHNGPSSSSTTTLGSTSTNDPSMMFSSISEDTTTTTTIDQHDPDASTRIPRRSKLVAHRDVTYLMTVARVARAPDLTLCCATLLLDISVLRMVLRGHEELFGPYIAALNELNVSGYDALMAVMNEVAIPK